MSLQLWVRVVSTACSTLRTFTSKVPHYVCNPSGLLIRIMFFQPCLQFVPRYFFDIPHSGSGKTSLLNILAGRTYTKGPLFVEADVYLDSFPVDPTRRSVQKQIAFVAQEDSLQATCTPREAIKFSAKLRLPRSMTEDQLDALVREYSPPEFFLFLFAHLTPHRSSTFIL